MIWLFTGCFLVATMVVIGGITRLTHSGLSMVNWKPVTGTLPPLNEEQWRESFESYQNSPEFKKINYHFTLEEYKAIFWWEYIHRLLGRVIGLVFVFPFIFFVVKKQIDKKLFKKLIGVFILGGLQGVLGWYMVMSGLVDRPSVSHYRLAAHLITALFLFSYIFWVALDLIQPLRRPVNSLYNRLFKFSLVLLFLLTAQIIYGAFVAGLKAGFIFNTYPLMAGSYVHPSIWGALSETGASALFDHVVTVQFIHRNLAIFLVGLGVFVWWKFKGNVIDLNIRYTLHVMLLVFALQFLLGVFTLINVVPAWLGVLHQFGAILLLAVLVYLVHSLRYFKPHRT